MAVLKVIKEIDEFKTKNELGLTLEELSEFVSRYSNINIDQLNEELKEVQRLTLENGDMIYVRGTIAFVINYLTVYDNGLIRKEE